jgi:hypothetical protein
MNLKSAPATILLGTLGLLLLSALGWVALIGPALGDLGEIEESRTGVQDRNHAMRLELTRLRHQAEELPASDALAADLDATFPPTADQPGFFAQLSDVTDAAGIPARDVTVLSPGVPVVPVAGADAGAVPVAPVEGEEVPDAAIGDLAVQLVEVTVKGDYAALTRVLEGIEDMPRAFLLDQVSVTGGEEESAELVLTVSGRTFVAPPLRPATS